MDFLGLCGAAVGRLRAVEAPRSFSIHREGISGVVGHEMSPLRLAAIAEISGFMKNASLAGMMSARRP